MKHKFIQCLLLVFEMLFALAWSESSNFYHTKVTHIKSQFSKTSYTDGVSPNCAKQMNILQSRHKNILDQMADAWSQIPFSGHLSASKNDFGNYDQCVSIEIKTETEGTILGKHCAYGILVSDTNSTNDTEEIEKGWKLSYCVPDQCSAKDLVYMTEWANINDLICSTNKTDAQIDIAGLTVLSLFIFFITLMTSATIYDLFRDQNKKPNAFFTLFSIYTNGKKLLAFENHSNGQALCFQGIKFISMLWIISGRSAMAWQVFPVMNDESRIKWQHGKYSQYITASSLALDSFFYISGFLLSYLYFNAELSKKSIGVQIKAIPSMVFHRYVRLTFPVLMMYLFYVYLLKYTGTGPFFSYQINGPLTESCRDNWWTVFLYFQNYYFVNSEKEMCINPWWYLSADMQLFFFAPVVIIPVTLFHRKSAKNALIALLAINVLFVALPIAIALTRKEYDPGLNQYGAHTRLTGYFIGVMMAVCMKNKEILNAKIQKKWNIFYWSTSLIVMFAIIMTYQEVTVNYGYTAKTWMYFLTRPTWCICLSWITFACFTGNGGYINWLLSNKFMQFGGKLTYCLYIIHGPLITHYTLTVRNRRYFSNHNLFYDWCGHSIVAVLIATFWTLAFELPAVTIERYLFKYKLIKVYELPRS